MPLCFPRCRASLERSLRQAALAIGAEAGRLMTKKYACKVGQTEICRSLLGGKRVERWAPYAHLDNVKAWETSGETWPFMEMGIRYGD